MVKGLKISLRRFLGKALIPRTNILANVTTCHPIVEIDRIGDRLCPVLDGVIGNTTVGIHHKGLGDRPRWASIKATGTSAAMLRMGLIWLQF